MKKINLFNRNIDLPSYRRRPVSRGFNRDGGIPFPGERGPAEQPGGMGITPSPLSPTKFLKFCGTRFGATPSWKEGERKVPSFRGNAESPRCCKELVCGKTDRIPLFSGMTVRICGMTMIVIAALFATPSFAEPTELDKKTVASKAYVDTKQDIIETGLVEFNDNPEYMLPAITTYDSTSGLVANKIGILDQETIADDEGNLNNYDGYGAEMDNFVPTVRAVAGGLVNKQNTLPAAWTSTTNPPTMASTGGQTIELNTAGNVKRRYITAGGSRPLTKKSGADNVILYINGTKTLAQYQTSNFGETGDAATTNQNYIKGALVSLELLKDVYSALHNEIQNATPTGTPGNVAMYDPSTGALGDGVATYDGSTTYNASTDADKIAVMSGVQRKKECGGYEPAPAGQPAHDGTHPGDEDYCWLWVFPD